MKIIKSLLLVNVYLCATTILHAQEVKTEVLKPTAIKLPPATTITNIPSPAPELKPMNGVALKEARVAATEAPSPLKKEENKNQVGPTNNLTAEQLKTLNGIADKPKPITPAATLNAQQNLNLPILLAPAPPIIKNEKQ